MTLSACSWSLLSCESALPSLSARCAARLAVVTSAEAGSMVESIQGQIVRELRNDGLGVHKPFLI